MKEFIDKLINELEKLGEHCLYMNNWQGQTAICDAISIVNQLAEEYKHCTLCYLQSPCEYQNENAILPVSELADRNGWIPCSERLPRYGDFVLVTVNSPQKHEVIISIYDNKTRSFFEDGTVIAWQPLPAPYTEGE